MNIKFKVSNGINREKILAWVDPGWDASIVLYSQVCKTKLGQRMKRIWYFFIIINVIESLVSFLRICNKSMSKQFVLSRL